MTLKTRFTVFIFLGVFSCHVFSQNCIEYPPIDGATCDDCIPDGWDNTLPSPDLIGTDGWHPWVVCTLDIDGASPTGGNVLFMVSAGSFSEGMSTDISGLDPGAIYGIGFYWHYILNCVQATDPSELVIEINGEIFTFSGSTEWELAEICFTATSESVTITVYAQTLGSGASYTVVDSGPECEDLTPCCLLIVELEEEEVTLCAGEEYIIPASYSDGTGSVNIEWTCDPPIGLDYLSEVDIINPIFNFPFLENHDGGVFEFTVTVEDDACTIIDEITIEVIPNEVPVFDIEICEFSDEDVFYSPSENGYYGNWVGNFNFEALSGTPNTYTFLIDSDQNNCLESYDYDFLIEEAIYLTFDIEEVYCIKDSEVYQLSNRSIENVRGEWNTDVFIPSDLGEGEYDFEFTPDPEYCAHPFEIEIVVERAKEVTFDLPSTFCSMNDTVFLSSISLENIEGEWSESYIDLNNLEVNQTLEFIPSDDVDCIDDYIYTYSILASSSASFNIEDSICRNNILIDLNPLSEEGYLGSWSPEQILLDTIISNSVNLTWTPDAYLMGCFRDTSITINIIDNPFYEFDIPSTLCTNNGVYILPTNSINNLVSGTWDFPTIQTNNAISQEIDLNFTPNNSCFETFATTIEIIEAYSASFNFQTEFCASDPSISLTNISNEGYTGTWSVVEINPSDINGSIVSSFIPDDDCVGTLEMTFYVEETVSPIFDLPVSLCGEDGYQFSFPQVSTNGVNGLWENDIFDATGFIGSTFNNLFTPEDENCHTEFSISIPIQDLSNFILNTLNPSDCISNDGEISIEGTSMAEMSLDNGLNWQSVDMPFTNLTSGSYTLLIRLLSLNDCETSFDLSLTSPEAPSILDVISTNISSCELTDGILECIAEGSNLEYSIDGTNWQLSNIFENLDAGVYTLTIRSDGSNLCTDSALLEIQAFPNSLILNVESNQPNDCESSDGYIIINAEGQNLEYSVDNGITWNDSNTFENLNGGTYSILVRSKDDNNCFDSAEEILITPVPPIIVEVLISPISSCESEDGIVNIEVDGENLEYSLDNGTTWQTDNEFLNLGAGIYFIQVINSAYPSCISESSFSLSAPDCPCNDLVVEYEVSFVNCIDPNSGSIVITNILGLNALNPEIIWSNGVIGEMNINIQEGEYFFEINYDNDCSHTETITVASIEPLTYETIVQDVDCTSLGSIEVINVSGGSGIPLFSIDGTNFQEDPFFDNLDPGHYNLSINDDLECGSSTDIDINDSTFMNVDIIDLAPTQIGEIIILNPEVSFTNVDSFSWINKEIIINDKDLILEVIAAENEEYSILIFDNNCTQEIIFRITIIEEDESEKNIYVGNIFSPNQDGNNDYLYIQSSSDNTIEIIEFSIYDRWGNKIFKQSNPGVNNKDNGWDGTIKNKNAAVGVYPYLIKYKLNGEEKILIGQVSLIR